MTKRAGKRKNRNGSQRHPPGRKAASEHEDNLPTQESQALEIRAIREGWLIDSPKSSQLRQALMQKVLKIGLSGEASDKTVISAFRALTTAELRQQQIQLASQNQELPQQVSVGVQVVNNQPAHEIIADLIQRREVREVL